MVSSVNICKNTSKLFFFFFVLTSEDNFSLGCRVWLFSNQIVSYCTFMFWLGGAPFTASMSRSYQKTVSVYNKECDGCFETDFRVSLLCVLLVRLIIHCAKCSEIMLRYEIINQVKLWSLGSGYFMHFNTGTANTGDTALLESRLVYPKRGYQCLQFFYYNSAGPSDTLKIYVREYDSANLSGTLRLIKTIDGDLKFYWSSKQQFQFWIQVIVNLLFDQFCASPDVL